MHIMQENKKTIYMSQNPFKVLENIQGDANNM